jgi:outer membrane receptor protein involved in Fe transport
MDMWWPVAGVLGVALLFGWNITNAVEVSVSGADEETFDFDIPALPLRSAAEAFAKRIGHDTYIGHETFEACGNFMVEPVVGRLTATEAWRKLTSPICAASGVVIEQPGDAPVYMVDHPWVAEHEITIARAPLVDALDALRRQFPGLLLEYRSRDPEEGRRLVGPIKGTMNPEEALRRIERQIGSSLHHRRSGTYAFLLESRTVKDAPQLRYRYARQCACPVNVEGVLGETVTVVDSAIPQRVRGAVTTYTRKQIESTGAATLPQFFRYLAQNGTTRPEGYVASGAQYADFRGLGWDTHLVTINGRRVLPSANSLTSSAFDLNTIPLPAVDRVDIRQDAASVRSGSDAIAGTIDIITRRELEGAMELRYGIASGGAEERRTTLSVGQQGSAGGFAALFDYLELGDLPGSERPLSRDQNYARYGGTDFRRPFAIRSIDGTNLPGLSTPLAGVPDTRQSDHLSIDELMPGEPQRVSLSRYRSLVPASKRASFVGSADYAWRGVKFAADLLWVKRDTAYDYFPAIAAGLVSKDLPGNPFDAPVQIEALLTGAPSMQQHVDSELRRAGLSARGRRGAWQWDLAVIDSDEKASAWVDHMLDPVHTAQALMATDADSALDVFAMQPGGNDTPAAIWADVRKQRFSSSGVNLFGGAEGPIGLARVQLGVERRNELMQFNAAVGRVERDVTGGFAYLTLPLVEPGRKVFGVSALTAFAGVRHDAFSDADAVTRTHIELKWNVTDRFVVDGNLAQQYRPPSLFELNLPIVAVPVPIYDTRRGEAVTALILSGGNPTLRPTTGKSTNIQATYESLDGFIASLNYFSIRLWDRIAVLPIPVVLAAEEALPGRIVRAPTPEEITAGRSGRITSLDTTRDNVGRLFTRGIDVSLHKTFDAAIGSLRPRLDFTWIDAFRYSDSPLASAVMTDRVGIAAEQGTITPWRAVASLEWQGQAWAATTYLRWIPGYQDVGGGHIGSQQLLDLNVSYRPSTHVTFTLGAMDLADTSPHFAKVGAATGYDSSQWEPVGRRVMLTARVSL